ncbi:aspartate kinase [Arthrobacter ginsengisoli]|uniref:Aspartokinase n=1 Tax=Arthrobacter ginsengisoli TaxID=1356565 RepID=A0ABU1UCH5_9MICC|nr:aspartate kinase [Arthrobacter ginsengisoli]MDR7082904.1 aspartate kinase [Arthrobacter ginsengisoli]
MLDERDWVTPRGSVIVQKFGGSSLADPSGILRAARRIAATRENGYQVVAVVSAMGDMTDELCDLAAAVSRRPHPGDLDALLSTGELVSSALLAIALADLGQAPVTFTGSMAGLITDGVHGKARITDVRPDRIRTSLARGEVPIVAGFQGRTKKGKRVTTLGRGGSDLTAVALAAALGASICEIYTDVDGVYTADPRIVPRARKIGVLSSEVMLEFAASGCKVLHLRCVEYARRFGIPIHVRSSFVPEMGTLILPGPDRHPFRKPVREQPVVTGVGGVNSAAKVVVVGVPNQPDNMARLFQVLSRSGVNVQTIVQSAAGSGSRRSDVALIVPALEASPALAVLGAAQGTIGFAGLQHRGEVGRVSITGVGMRSSPDVVCTFLWTLSEAGIDIDLVEISETYVAAITRAERLPDAERAVRLAFGMAPAAVGPARSAPPPHHGPVLDGDSRWGHGPRGLAPSHASRSG